MIRHGLLIGAALLLCAAREPRPTYEPSYPETPPPPPANGAIFQAGQGYAPLTSGARAAAVGDVITIVLVERMQGSTVNGVTTARDGSLGLTPPSTGPLSFFQPSDVSMGGANEFDGQGRATQSNSLFGEISVTVAAVMPNGNLIVQGEKAVRINRGDEFIRVSGIVRATDIGPDNRVASTRIADANIVYSGRGEVARASRQGWLQRFFTIVSPF
ncbi:flagellar basal body L-ring protein FlgH [Sphingosinicella sp. CPCC 101087]|uniref:flagellar basal body L-ring protein FlgH n=1 Tax=Sphingosinicella sp. CPCC 101087 TaxID=2497754 RepID=UPI00101D2B1E|nr:flagellar basal body L-ring protein FlgH [Sphingosinicella sp. CPCC 101087]